jgi:hypothetical protein
MFGEDDNVEYGAGVCDGERAKHEIDEHVNDGY